MAIKVLFLRFCYVDRIDDKLAVSAPRQSTEIAFPMKLHTGVGAVIQLLCHMLIHDRELKLVRLDRTLHFGVFLILPS